MSAAAANEPSTSEVEVAQLNAQIARLEETIEEQARFTEIQLETSARRERELVSSAAACVNSIFSAIPVRCGTLESGRFVIRTHSACAPQAFLSQSAQSAGQGATPLSPKLVAKSTSCPPDRPGSACGSGQTSPAVSSRGAAEGVRSSTVRLECGAAGTVRGRIKFRCAYEAAPKVLAWVQRAELHVAERLPNSCIAVELGGFSFCIEHEDPNAMDRAVVNWIATTPPPSNPELATMIAAVQANTSNGIGDLEKMLKRYTHAHGVEGMDNNGQTLLHVAAYAGNTELVKWLLKKGARLNAVDESGWTALLCAIGSSHFDAALELIKLGADCSVFSESENNSLHYLARCQEVSESCKALVGALTAKGCDPNMPNKEGDTPLGVLCLRNPRTQGHFEMLDLLLRGGANANLVNNASRSPLHFAIDSDNVPLALKLLDGGADAESGLSLPTLAPPVTYAAAKGSPQMVTAINESIAKKKAQQEQQLRLLRQQQQAQHAVIPALNSSGKTLPAISSDSLRLLGKPSSKILQIDVVEAKDVVQTPADVYCLLRCGKDERRTNVCFQATSPRWNESFRLECHEPTLVVQVWSWNMAKSNVPFGEAQIALSEIADVGVIDQWFPFTSTRAFTIAAKAPKGQLHLRIQVQTSKLCTRPSGMKVIFTFNGKVSEIVKAEGDKFTSVPLPREEWIAPVPVAGQQLAPWCVDSSCLVEGVHLETSYSSVTHKHSGYEEFDSSVSVPFYSQYLAGTPHCTVFCADENEPLVFTLEDANERGSRMLIMRTKKEDRRMVIPNGKGDIAAIRDGTRLFDSSTKLVCTRSVVADDLLLVYERLHTVSRYKFGMMYAKPGQSSESECLSNVQGSPAFEDFLNLMGTRSPLKGLTCYAGGLDTKNDNTGTHSYVTTFGEEGNRLEIMFHVASMLPFQPNDVQRIERKRHIGNDVVVVIFKESSSPEDVVVTNTFISHFNHVFIVVSPVAVPGGALPTEYRVTVATKAPVKPFPPFFPSTCVTFKKDSSFRTWLLKKMINGERTALESPDFRGSLMGTRKKMLLTMIRTLSG